MKDLPMLPEEFFDVEGVHSYSYHFADSNGRRIPNALGWRVIGMIKSSCMANGRPIIDHTEVSEILKTHTRESLVALMESNGAPWAPEIKKARKAAHEDAHLAVKQMPPPIPPVAVADLAEDARDMPSP